MYQFRYCGHLSPQYLRIYFLLARNVAVKMTPTLGWPAETGPAQHFREAGASTMV